MSEKQESGQRGLDPQTLHRLARSFYVVRMARYAALLLALGAVLALSLATEAPYVVSAAAFLVVIALGAAALVTRRRWRAASAQTSQRSSSGSPTA